MNKNDEGVGLNLDALDENAMRIVCAELIESEPGEHSGHKGLEGRSRGARDAGIVKEECGKGRVVGLTGGEVRASVSLACMASNSALGTMASCSLLWA